jgi:hypothetical protein
VSCSTLADSLDSLPLIQLKVTTLARFVHYFVRILRFHKAPNAVNKYRGSNVCQSITLLHFAGRSDCEQAGNGNFASFTTITEHDFAPDDGMPQSTFGAVVGRFDALIVDEREEIIEIDE